MIINVSRGTYFRASSSKGAILMMPEGAISEDLEDIPRFREYAAANVETWYRYINGTLGCRARNGDVRLVVGCDKATSWGMATLPNTSQHRQLKFKRLGAQSLGSLSCGYSWECSGTAEVRVGPDLGEIEELRREDPAGRDTYLNQCLFVRTLNATLNDNDWESLSHRISTAYSSSSISENGTEASSHSLINRGARCHPSFNLHETLLKKVSWMRIQSLNY